MDIVENFILFAEVKGGLIKLIAKNHQYLGVNSAFKAVQEIKENQGRLGVFWHTQGQRQILFDDPVLRQSITQTPGQLDFCGGHRSNTTLTTRSIRTLPASVW